MYGEVFVSTISLVFLLLMAFSKLVAKIVKLYVSGLPTCSRLHACMQYIRAPPTLVCRPIGYAAVIIIWQVQNGDPTRAYELDTRSNAMAVWRSIVYLTNKREISKKHP